MLKTYWGVLWVFFLLFFSAANSAERSRDSAVELALEWMAGNPVMSKASPVVESIETFPDLGTYSVYVVQLSPTGYLVLNSDDRLPLLVSFSADSRVNLSDDPHNALRPMLISYCAQKEEELANWTSPQSVMMTIDQDELYGPFLETTWNQSDPYNLLCPSASGGYSSNDGRAPSGCVPTTFAQLMNYHRWPYYGSGSRSYTDSSGSTTGSHSADFFDPYDWGNMNAAHSSSDPQVNQEAVAELMYEIGIAAEVDYEAGGTSGNSITLGSSLGEYCYYDTIESYETGDGADIIVPLEADLRAGFPCAVSYPGHAFIADGLMVDSGSTTYHFNMGWGGYNDGWYTEDAAPTGGGSETLDGSITSFRPQLMAFPQTNSVSGNTGGSAEVNWVFPKRLGDQVSKLTIKQLEQQAGSWTSTASEITGLSSGWEVVSAGRSGDCWYGGDYGTFSMVLNEVFVPNTSSTLTFWMKYTLYNDLFSVSVSTDCGVSYSPIFSEEYTGYPGWGQKVVSLAAYAGQGIRIKFSLRVSGSYYPSGGIWLDDLAVTSCDWYDWQTFAEDTILAERASGEVGASLAGQPVHYTALSGLSAGSYTLAAVLTDTNAVEHAIGPSFTLTVSGDPNDTDSDGLPNDWEVLYFGGETNANPSAICANGINTVLETYVAGLDPTDPDALFEAALTHGSALWWHATSGRVYSVWSTTNLLESFQPLETNILWPQASWTDSVPRVESFYRIDVQLAD